MTKKLLEQLYKEHQGKVSDKWSIYLPIYDRLLDSYRGGATRLLEIGIQNGGSLDIWAKFFPNAQNIVGCDINPDCAVLSYDHPCISVVVGDANTDTTQAAILAIAKKFDVIIDDGSHRSSDIIRSFVKYWPHLSDGGVYVAEDLHCSYWEGYEGGLFDPYSSLSFFKRLTDVINYEHWGLDGSRGKILAGIFLHYGIELQEEAFEHIHSLEFINSVCVLKKRILSKNVLGSRIFAGSVADVIPDHIVRCLSLNHAVDERSNRWSNMSLPPDEEYIQLQNKLAERTTQLDQQNTKIAEREQQINQVNMQIDALYQSASWRITAPLRFLSTQVKRLFSVRSS